MTEKKARENYTRVTTILKPFSGLDKIDEEVLKKAGNRGTKVHKICEGIMLGLGELGVDAETRGYIESFKKWWTRGHKIVTMEERFYDDDLEVSGQVDMILQTEEGLVIADLKTNSRPSQTWEAQGCAYAYLAKKAGHDIKGIHFIHLSKTGREAMVYKFKVDDSFFFAILRVWNHFFKED